MHFGLGTARIGRRHRRFKASERIPLVFVMPADVTRPDWHIRHTDQRITMYPQVRRRAGLAVSYLAARARISVITVGHFDTPYSAGGSPG